MVTHTYVFFQDLGCGIGGPARHIAALTDCHITGLNINKYQVERCKELTKRAKLDHLVNFEVVLNRFDLLECHVKYLSCKCWYTIDSQY